MSEFKEHVSHLLHQLRDGLLVAATHLERGDEVEAAESLEQTLTHCRDELQELRAA